MRLKEIIYSHFVLGGHFLSIGASCIVITIAMIFHLNVSLQLIVIPYIYAQIIYSYNHYRELKFDLVSNPDRAKFVLKNKINTWIQFVSYIILLVVLSLSANIKTLIFSFIIIIGGILYTEYFKKLTEKKLIGFKNLYTSIFWSSLVLFVILLYELRLSTGYFLFFMFTLIRWLLNTIYFDIKDVKADKERKLQTFPVIFGKNYTLLILHLINFLSVIPILYGVHKNSLAPSANALLILFIYSFIYLVKSNNVSKEKLLKISYIIVDGEYLLWPILIYIYNYF